MKKNNSKTTLKGQLTQKDFPVVRENQVANGINVATTKMEQDQVEGRNSVIELLESKRDINKIYIQTGERHGSINKIIAMAKERKIIISEISKEKLNQIAQTENPQGVIAIVPPFDYSSVEEILFEANTRQEEPFVVILDGIEDEQ